MIDQDLRDLILAAPEKLLQDRDVMAALIAASDAQAGNVIDLRAISMQKLQEKLDTLEETHRSVIAAAYENLAGTNQVNRAILALLDAATLHDFLNALAGSVAQTLKIDAVGLLLESPQDVAPFSGPSVLRLVGAGTIAAYLSTNQNSPIRPVLLRQYQPENDLLYGENAADVRSEALMLLDFGQGHLPGLLAFGSKDPHHFKSSHGTDLLAHFAGVLERSLRRWLG